MQKLATDLHNTWLKIEDMRTKYKPDKKLAYNDANLKIHKEYIDNGFNGKQAEYNFNILPVAADVKEVPG